MDDVTPNETGSGGGGIRTRDGVTRAGFQVRRTVQSGDNQVAHAAPIAFQKVHLEDTQGKLKVHPLQCNKCRNIQGPSG